MSLLTPLYLLGAVAIALPVVFHLIRRTTRRRMPFSSLMFLRAAPVRLSERSRIEDRLLLTLRAAVLALLAVGFARPFRNAAAASGGAGTPPARTVLAIDTSASMRREGLWEEARRRAQAVADAAGPADELAILTFDRVPHAVLRFEEASALAPGVRAALARERLAAITPGWGSTHLDQALIEASEWIAGGEQVARREIVLLSDFQRGSERSALQAFAWPDGVVVRAEALRPRTDGNAGLQLVADRRELEGGDESGVRVRIVNSADAAREQFALGWSRGGGAEVADPVDAYVPAGQSRVVSLAPPDAADGAGVARLRNDAAAFDDSLYVIPPRPVRLRVAYFGSEDDADSRSPLYFLRRAFPPTPRLTVEIDVFPPDQPVGAGALEPYTLIAATGRLADDTSQSIHAALQDGRMMLFAPVDAAAMTPLSTLTGADPITPAEGAPREFALLGQLDFQHPLLAPFASPAYSDFSGIHFWHYRKIPEDALASARVLARFDTGDPAWVDVPVGEGRLLLLASCWHPVDSQLALSSKFVPMLYAMLELAGDRTDAAVQYVVGDALPIPAGAGEGAVMRRPDGDATPLAADTRSYTDTDLPGLYRVEGGGVDAAYAVNIAPAESDTTPAPVDELAQLGVPFGTTSVDTPADARRRVVLANLDVEARQRWWRWLIAAALAVAVAETWFAGWTARRPGRREGALA